MVAIFSATKRLLVCEQNSTFLKMILFFRVSAKMICFHIITIDKKKKPRHINRRQKEKGIEVPERKRLRLIGDRCWLFSSMAKELTAGKYRTKKTTPVRCVIDHRLAKLPLKSTVTSILMTGKYENNILVV